MLGLQADIFLAAVYLLPLQSQRKAGEDVISILEKEIHKYSTQGQILLLGDFNARTGTLNDFIENNADDFLTIHNTYNRDTDCPKRNNTDYTMNKVGREILRLCIGNRLRILNGRLTGDLDGKYTCYQTNGASTVDYALASEDLIKTILGFQVQALTTYSDHCPISLKLTSSRPHMVEDNAPRQPLCKAVPTQKNFKKFLWKADSKDKFLSALSNPNVQRLFDSFNSEHHASVDDEISQFNQIINSVAKSCLATSRKTSKTTKEKKPWYDHTCRQLKKQLQQLVKKINPSSQQSLRQDYFVLKKKYKKCVKMMHKRYKKQIVNEINALHLKHS